MVDIFVFYGLKPGRLECMIAAGLFMTLKLIFVDRLASD